MTTAGRLRYATDDRPGIRRRRRGTGFSYETPEGGVVRDRETLARIRALAVPPAWTDVWISPDPDTHLQATGRDARGRKQHRYHPDFRARRERAKYERMIRFGEVLPAIREQVERDLGRAGLPREKVLAAVVRLLETSLIRVGGEEYARRDRSFGLTTLQDRHARIDGAEVRFRFRGKSGKRHDVALADRRLARIVARCQDLPGQDLFQYMDDDGEVRDVRSEDVNAYLRAIAGDDVSAKDFRTWAGTVLAWRALQALQPDGSSTKKAVVEAMKATAERLGNTPTVARNSYVHPAVLEAYTSGELTGALTEVAEEQVRPPTVATPDEEAAVLELLRSRQSLRRSSRKRGSRASSAAT